MNEDEEGGLLRGMLYGLSLSGLIGCAIFVLIKVLAAVTG